jgi:hypothetical protein
MTVPVAVESHDSEPSTDFAAWDHIAECSLDLPAGRAVITGLTGNMLDASRIPVAPGCYRVRPHFGALDSLSWDGLQGFVHFLHRSQGGVRIRRGLALGWPVSGLWPGVHRLGQSE